ncbi:hypothetical protein AB0392_25730 [Nonomuraea angiospora]|uniref:hypothetical protein n=1 Tax=Nonomuraea angiospora TaxID=46172 RepID=UPI003450B26F
MGDQPNERGAVVNPLLERSPSRPRVKLLTMLVIAHVLAGACAAFATYDPYDKRDISFILQKAREGKVREATLIDDEQRISVSTIDGQKWYAHYGPPGLSPEALMEELIRADPLGNLKVTTEVSVWGMRLDSTAQTAQV